MPAWRNSHGSAAAAWRDWQARGLVGDPIELPGYDLIYVCGQLDGRSVLVIFSDRFVCLSDDRGVPMSIDRPVRRLAPHELARPGVEDE